VRFRADAGGGFAQRFWRAGIGPRPSGHRPCLALPLAHRHRCGHRGDRVCHQPFIIGNEGWRYVISSGAFRSRELEFDPTTMSLRKQHNQILFYEDGSDATVTVEQGMAWGHRQSVAYESMASRTLRPAATLAHNCWWRICQCWPGPEQRMFLFLALAQAYRPGHCSLIHLKGLRWLKIASRSSALPGILRTGTLCARRHTRASLARGCTHRAQTQSPALRCDHRAAFKSVDVGIGSVFSREFTNSPPAG